MSDRLLPAIAAVLIATVLAVVLFVPYIAAQYRRRGTVGARRVVLAFALLVYVGALGAYTLLPLPASTDACVGVGTQLTPFQFVADIARESQGGAVPLWSNPALLQVILNVALFAPLGVFARVLFERGIVVSVLLGAAASLLIEFTQLTGVWFLYPCSYRIFDVDDLIANSLGAVIGVAVAPALRWLAGTESRRTRGEPRPVTAGRRLLGMLCDLVATSLTGFLLLAVYVVAVPALTGVLAVDVPGAPIIRYVLVAGLPAAGQLALILVTGSTLGERAVLLEPRAKLPSLGVRVVRFLFGIGGYTLLAASTLPLAPIAAFALGVAAVIAVFATRERRGLAYAVSGLEVRDSRASENAVEAPASARNY